MKTYIYLIFCLFLISCNSKDNSNNTPINDSLKESTESSPNELKSSAKSAKHIKPASKIKLGAKYQELVDKGYLNIQEAKSYSDIESKYKKIRVELQDSNRWQGDSPDNINQRKKWQEDKKLETISALGQSNYDKITKHLQSKK